MIIINTTTNTVNYLGLRIWRGGWNAGFEPDCFDDLADDLPLRCPRDDEGRLMMDAAQLVATCKWWREECDAANSGKDGELLLALSGEELERGDEWVFICDEV